MKDTDDPSRRNSPSAANDNVSRAVRKARLAWAEQQTLVRGNVYHALKLILSLADADGIFHVDGKFFAHALKTSRRTAFSHVRKLMDAKVIEDTKRKRWVYTYYKLTLPPEAASPSGSSENLARCSEDIAEEIGRSRAHKIHKDPYHQGTSGEVSMQSEWRKKKNKEAPVQSHAGRAKPLSPHEGEHIPAELRQRFVGWFGPDTARSWLFRCSWRAGEHDALGVLETTSEGVKKWFEREARAFCQDNRIEVRLVGGGRG